LRRGRRLAGKALQIKKKLVNGEVEIVVVDLLQDGWRY
jgi:hypothetical protein